jgi:hypothetical protein
MVNNMTGIRLDVSILRREAEELDPLDMYLSNSGMPDRHPRVQRQRYTLCVHSLSSVRAIGLLANFPKYPQTGQSI